MPQEQVRKEEEQKPASESGVGRSGEKEIDPLDLDDLISKNEKKLKKFRQVGQSGGQ